MVPFVEMAQTISTEGAASLPVRLSRRWKGIAQAIGNFQARILLTVFYFVVVLIFAFLVKCFTDPLRLRPPVGDSFWVARLAKDQQDIRAWRQF